jgi:hypothetical protein
VGSELGLALSVGSGLVVGSGLGPSLGKELG